MLATPLPTRRSSAPPEPDCKKLVKLNISGWKFYTYLSTLKNYPDTLLGSDEREEYFSPELNCYFFERERRSFEAILNFYRTGALSCPASIEQEDFESECNFFKITHAQEEDKVLHVRESRFRSWPKWQRKIYYVVAEPGQDTLSRVWAFLDTFFIMCSIILFVAETEPYFKEKLAKKASFVYKFFFWGDAVCVIFFTFDFSLRLIVWPGKANFLKSVLNWLDFLAILPFFIMIITDYILTKAPLPEGELEAKGSFVALKVLRLMRVIRLLKLARHNDQLMLIVNVFKRSLNELSILVLLWLIGIVTFGSIIYYADSHGDGSDFTSIRMGCWWAVVTMSTVGYGDIVPITITGRLLGSVVVFLSMIFLAIPMTIIVSKFSSCYAEINEGVPDERDYLSSEDDREDTGMLKVEVNHVKTNGG